MKLDDSDINSIEVLLSVERIKALAELTGSTREAIELHQEILRLGNSLMTVIAIIEIAIRNTVCDCLSGHFGTTDWLLNPPQTFQWRSLEKTKIGQALNNARHAEYAKLGQAEKHNLDALAFPSGRPENLSHKNRVKERQAIIKVTYGKLIAELTLFFWKRLYSSDYEEALWKTTLKRTFPDKYLRRADIAPHLEEIYQTRNRLAHHEPVYGRRMSKILEAIEFVSTRLGATHADNANPLAKLLAEDIDRVTEQSLALDKLIASYKIAD